MESTQPRISVNKLGEYMEVGPARRRSIVNAQKKPPGEVVVARYVDAVEVLKEYFESGSEDLIYRRATELRAYHAGSSWMIQDKHLSADALIACADILELLNLRGMRVLAASPNVGGQSMLIAGVKVSVRPQFIVVDPVDVKRVIGGIKFSFNKQNPLGETGCEYVATVMRQSLASIHGSAVDSRLCLSVATATRQVIHAPKAHKARMSSIEAACEEIANRWGALVAA